MKRRFWSGALMLLALSASSAEAKSQYFALWPSQLQSDVVRIQRSFSGEFALVVKDLSTGVQYTYNASTPMYLASGIKVPVMVALFRQVKAGRVNLSDELVYEASDLRDGSMLLSYLRAGTPISLRSLLEAMIQKSDNSATDMMIQHLGIDAVNRSLTEENVTGFGPITTLLDVRRLVFKEIDPRAELFTAAQIFEIRSIKTIDGRVAKIAELLNEPAGKFTAAQYHRAYRIYYESGANSASMNAMTDLLTRIVQGQVVSPQHSRQMLDVMLGTQTGLKRIRAGLPPDVALAHKTGTQYQRTCDFGVFFMTGGRPVIFAISVKGGRRGQAEHVISQLTRRAYWHLASPRERRKVRAWLANQSDSVAVDEKPGEAEGAASMPKPRRKRSKRRAAPKP